MLDLAKVSTLNWSISDSNPSKTIQKHLAQLYRCFSVPDDFLREDINDLNDGFFSGQLVWWYIPSKSLCYSMQFS